MGIAIRAHPRSGARRARALELRAAGLSLREIVRATGSSLTTVHRDIEQALAQWGQPAADSLRELEGSRLDQAQSAIWSHVLEGDLDAINSFLKISTRRAALFGLDASTRIELVGGVLDQFVAAQGWSSGEIIALLQQAALAPALSEPIIEGEVVEVATTGANNEPPVTAHAAQDGELGTQDA
jgi:uncharacterized protein YfiM (DUF2279 family)